MLMVIYTEEELIEATEAAKADALRDFDEQRTRYMSENTMLRRECNDLLEALKDIVNGIDLEFGPSRTDTNFPKARRAITKYGVATLLTPAQPHSED